MSFLKYLCCCVSLLASLVAISFSICEGHRERDGLSCSRLLLCPDDFGDLLPEGRVTDRADSMAWSLCRELTTACPTPPCSVAVVPTMPHLKTSFGFLKCQVGPCCCCAAAPHLAVPLCMRRHCTYLRKNKALKRAWREERNFLTQVGSHTWTTRRR